MYNEWYPIHLLLQKKRVYFIHLCNSSFKERWVMDYINLF